MNCLTSQRRFNFQDDVNFGTIILIVEGQETEFELFVKIFHEIAGCNVLARSRKDETEGIRIFHEYVRDDKSPNKVIIVNTDNSQIDTINHFEEKFEQIQGELIDRYEVTSIKNSRIFYIWDRDRYSNPEGITRKLVERLNSPSSSSKKDRDNTTYEGGLLLLSYPAIETYTESTQRDNSGERLEKYREEDKNAINLTIATLEKGDIEKAASIMNKVLSNIFSIERYNLEDVSALNLEIFNQETQAMSSDADNHTYYKLSMVSIMLQILKILE